MPEDHCRHAADLARLGSLEGMPTFSAKVRNLGEVIDVVRRCEAVHIEVGRLLGVVTVDGNAFEELAELRIPRDAVRSVAEARTRPAARQAILAGAVALLIACMATDQSGAQPTGEVPPPAVPAAPPEGGGSESAKEIRARGEQWFAQCMQDWDSGTHMTKKEWERTCRRLVKERVKFLLGPAK